VSDEPTDGKKLLADTLWESLPAEQRDVIDATARAARTADEAAAVVAAYIDTTTAAVTAVGDIQRLVAVIDAQSRDRRDRFRPGDDRDDAVRHHRFADRS
jgi:hypothetical protein